MKKKDTNSCPTRSPKWSKIQIQPHSLTSHDCKYVPLIIKPQHQKRGSILDVKLYAMFVLLKTYSKPTKTAIVIDKATIDRGVKDEVNTPKDLC